MRDGTGEEPRGYCSRGFCRPYFLLLSGGNCHFISWIARKINVRRSLVIYTVGNRPTGLAAVLIEILGEGGREEGCPSTRP